MEGRLDPTRFEVIDETGRILVRYDVSVMLIYQDEGQTLKVFLTHREKDMTEGG